MPEARSACILVLALDQSSNWLGHGSGFILTESGVVVTNRHVIEQARSANGRLLIVLPSGAQWVMRNALNADVGYFRDLAIIHTGERSETYLKLADSDQVRLGQRVYAIGTPLSPENFNTITSGTIAGVTTSGDIEAHVEVCEGSSGSPLVDDWGQLVGVVWGGSGKPCSTVALAIPSKALEEFAGTHVRQMQRQEDVKAAESYLALAEQAERDGLASKAIKLYETALTYDPRNQKAHFALGRLYQKIDMTAAIEHYSEWLKLAPGKYSDGEIARIRAHVESLKAGAASRSRKPAPK